MNLLQRHLFVQAALSCLAASGFLAALLITANALKDLLPLLADGRIAPWMFLQGLLLLTPYVLTYALPAGVLVGVLLLLGRLSAQHEITAMRSAGLGLFQIASPVFLFALLGVVVSVFVNFQYGPAARSHYRAELARSIQNNPQSFLVQKTFIREFPGYVLYFGEREEGRLSDVWVWVVDGQRRATRFIRAREANLVFDEAAFAFTLNLIDAQAELRDPEDPENVDAPPYLPSAGELTLQLPLDRLLGGAARVNLSRLTYAQLRDAHRRAVEQEKAARLASEGVEEAFRGRIRIQLETQERLSSAFAVLSFALLAVPLGFKFKRKETSANLGIALILAMTFYLMQVFIGWFDKQPHLRPDLLIWIPNLLFQALGLLLLRRSG